MLMTLENDLIVFLIQAVLKTTQSTIISQVIPSNVSNRHGNILPPITPRIAPPRAPGIPQAAPQNQQRQQDKHSLPSQHQNDTIEEQTDCIENFKCAKRCKISMPYSKPKLLESYADYFIVGGYQEKPFQVDIFDRTKVSILSINVARELKRAMHRHQITDARIVSLDFVLVPRLKWSDRMTEQFEQKKRQGSSNNYSSSTKIGVTQFSRFSNKTGCCLRRLLFIGNVQLSEDGPPEAFVLSYKIQDRKPDKMKLLSFVQDSRQITAINYGPFDNGHLLLGLDSGYLLAYDVNNSFDLVFQMQLCQHPLTSISFDPTHLILVSSQATKHVYAVSLIDKK